MQFATNGSNERLRITSAGKVGINSEGTPGILPFVIVKMGAVGTTEVVCSDLVVVMVVLLMMSFFMQYMMVQMV